MSWDDSLPPWWNPGNAPQWLQPRPPLPPEFDSLPFDERIECMMFTWKISRFTALMELQNRYAKRPNPWQIAAEALVPPEQEIERSEIQEQFQNLGLSYRVDKKVLDDLRDFRETYGLPPPSQGEWITGPDVCIRWGLTQRELANCVLTLPVYLLNGRLGKFENVSDKITRHDTIIDFQANPESWLGGDTTREKPNVWFSIPQLWIFKGAEVEFLEKLEHGRTEAMSRTIKCIEEIPPSLRWLSPREVQGRWLIWDHQLPAIVKEESIPVFKLSSSEGITPASISLSPVWGGNPLGGCLFRLWDLQTFELRDSRRKNKRLSLHARRLDKLLARDMTGFWVRRDPTIRSGQVVERLKKSGQFDHITRDETLRTYVVDLLENHDRGRPKNFS